MAIFDLRWRWQTEPVLTIPVACVGEILLELVGRYRGQKVLAIPNLDCNRRVGFVFVPNPARNGVTIDALKFC